MLVASGTYAWGSRSNSSANFFKSPSDALSLGIFSAIVPSGGSTGQYEALEMRDGGPAWNGKGVTKAVSNVNIKIAKKIQGQTFASQSELDDVLKKI